MLKNINSPISRPIQDKQMKDMRSRVFQHMLKTRGWKYRAFLRYLRLFKYAAFSPTRGAFLESYYTLMRYLDDIVDGDAPLPPEYTDEKAYILGKIQFSQVPLHPVDEVDHLMVHCFELADRFGEDFREETNDILNSLLFDARRRGRLEIFPQRELSLHFHQMDIRGTIRATLKVFKEDPDKYLLLEPLGMASRYQFDLEDFEADIAAGYVNISREACEQLGITEALLHDSHSRPIRQWFRQRAEAGLALLEEHRRRLPQGHFSLLSRATFPLVYETPARKCFNKVLRKYRP